MKMMISLVAALMILASPMAFAKPCDAYVKCVCDWSEALVKAGAGDAAAQKAQCAQVKQMYSAAPAQMQPMCKDAHTMFKDTLKQSAAAYASLNLKVPASCK